MSNHTNKLIIKSDPQGVYRWGIGGFVCGGCGGFRTSPLSLSKSYAYRCKYAGIREYKQGDIYKDGVGHTVVYTVPCSADNQITIKYPGVYGHTANNTIFSDSRCIYG